MDVLYKTQADLLKEQKRRMYHYVYIILSY